MNRVVITGIGVVSPVGNDTSSFWESIKEGKHGINKIENFETEDIGVSVAAQVKDFDPLLSMDKKGAKRNDLYCQFALEAARQAIEDCKSRFEDTDPYRKGVIIGSGIGGIQSLESAYGSFLEKGAKRISPLAIPMLISNMAAGVVAMQYGFKGINFGMVSACATSSHTIGEAYQAIKHGKLDVCMAGGAEAAVTRFTLSGFNSMKTLSTSKDPSRASIPFDKERNGFVMGEGAAVLILESLESARARDAHIYAEIAGYGATADAYHITCPDPTGEAAGMAMTLAMEEAGITPEEVDYINAHGTSTPINDKCETNIIKQVFGPSAQKVMISSSKSMTGHLLGAAGALESAICIKALEEGFIPMTAGYRVPDSECDLNYVTESGVKKDISYALSNSFGFGGHNATLCFKKYID